MEYVIRFLYTLLKTALVLAIVVVLCVGGFMMAMNVSNIYVLVGDGMKMRTSVVMGLNEADELPKFFSQSCIQTDEIYQDNTYLDYDMESFSSDVSVSKLHTLPWEDTATVTLKQNVSSVIGYLPISKQNAQQLANPKKIPAPEWKSQSFELELKKWQDQWKIVSLTPIETQEEETKEQTNAG